jgi:outer membrane protein assembly factor BamB
MDSEKLGHDLGDFLRGFLGVELPNSKMPSESLDSSSKIYASSSSTSEKEKSQKGYYENAEYIKPDPSKIRMFVNRGASLKKGHLLLVNQTDATVYCMDPETGEYEFVFRLYDTVGFLFRAIATPQGDIFCTVTGTRYAHDRNGIIFGAGGAVLKIDHRREKIQVVPGSNGFTDPCGLQLLNDGSLIVTDFEGFHGAGPGMNPTGSVYNLDPVTGRLTSLASGGLLRIPIGAYLDSDEMLYVSNAQMRYEYPDEPIPDTGNVLRFNTKTMQQDIFVAESNPPQGALLGVNGSPDEPFLIIVTAGAPMFTVGALISVEKQSGKTEFILSSSEDKHRFFSPHSEIRDGILYTADSYQKELLLIDVRNKSIIRTLSLKEILGSYKGVINQFNLIDCVSIIP